MMSCIVNGPVATELDACVHLGSPQNYSNYVKATPDSIGKKKLPPRWNVMGIIAKMKFKINQATILQGQGLS